MPEIAEVETVRKVLKRKILHKKITDINVYYSKIIENSLKEFKEKLVGEEFIDINRKGKYLLFETNNNYLISHLRMEGKYYIKDNNLPKEKHEHVKFVFADNSSLRYEDVRKFGRIRLVSKDNLTMEKELKNLGYEPLSKDLTASYLYQKLKNKKKPMKSLLLDQTIICGLGNIYADEVLFASGINPLRLGNTISEKECIKIIEASNKIIKKAIECGGTTIRSYTSSLGVTGHYQNYLKVHTKDKEKCYNCNENIQKIVVGGRSTYFCPKCQK